MEFPRQILEGLLNAGVLLGGDDVDTHELVEVGEALGRGEVDLSVQVALVPDEHADRVGGEVLAVLDPLREVVQRAGLAHAVQEHRGVRVPVVVPGQRPEPLDSRRVPDGERDVIGVHAEERRAGVDAGRGGLALVEGVVSEAPEHRALPHAQLSQQHHLVVRTPVSHS